MAVQFQGQLFDQRLKTTVAKTRFYPSYLQARRAARLLAYDKGSTLIDWFQVRVVVSKKRKEEQS